MVVLPLLVRLVNYCTSIICFVQEHAVKYMKKMRIILSEQTIYMQRGICREGIEEDSAPLYLTTMDKTSKNHGEMATR